MYWRLRQHTLLKMGASMRLVAKGFLLLALCNLTMVYAVPSQACPDHQIKHRLVTFIHGEQEVQGFWWFCWDNDVRRSRLLLRAPDGKAITIENTMSLFPTLSLATDLRAVKTGPMFRLNVRYPSVIASTFAQAITDMVPGEPVEVSLSVPGEEGWEDVTSIPEDQTDGFTDLVSSLVAPRPLSEFVPSELRPIIQILAEVAGPRRQLRGGETDRYAMDFGLLGALDNHSNDSSDMEDSSGVWTVVEHPMRKGAAYDEEEQAFLRSIGRLELLE